jgi:hypothetical protein
MSSSSNSEKQKVKSMALPQQPKEEDEDPPELPPSLPNSSLN